MTRALLWRALDAHRALREWARAVPKDAALPVMPGIDGDWLDSVEESLHAELAKPEHPAPAWHDAPTCPGLWLCDEGDSDPYCFTTHRVTWPLNSLLLGDGERWYGPIPEDGK